jgi:signal peptidase I
MTMQPPRTEDEPTPSITANGGIASPGGGTRAATATTARTTRAPDYRLRGLDLDAPVFTEAQPRPVRKKHPSNRRRRRRLLLQWAIVLVVIAAVAVLLRIFVVQPYSVSSSSMVPTLSPGTDVLVVKWSALTGSIKAGDVVVTHEPADATCTPGGGHAHEVVARVIGLPGETIWSVAGTIYVNGQRLNEPGWYNPPFGELGSADIVRTTIPQGSYFVMDDNRTDSCDSRSFGPVPRSLFIGEVVATIARHGHPVVHGI